jgi:hypothetical protein
MKEFKLLSDYQKRHENKLAEYRISRAIKYKL